METTSVTWARLRKLVQKRDKSICYHCGQVAEDGHCDHLIPISSGGTDVIENLVWSCGSCNTKKGRKKNFVSPNNPFGFPNKPTPKQLPYPRFNGNILERLLLQIVKSIIPPYPEYSDLRFSSRNYYWKCIKKMRQIKIETWLRETIWVTPCDARDVIDWENTVNDIDDYVENHSRRMSE